MGRTSTARERLIDAGCDLLHSRGYSALGVADICAAADVRKGSFYHFFESKQVLAVEVVRSAWQVQRQDWTRALSADEPALTRLQRLLELQAETQRADKTTTGALRGCLFGNLAQEMNQDTAVSAAVLRSLRRPDRTRSPDPRRGCARGQPRARARHRGERTRRAGSARRNAPVRETGRRPVNAGPTLATLRDVARAHGWPERSSGTVGAKPRLVAGNPTRTQIATSFKLSSHRRNWARMWHTSAPESARPHRERPSHPGRPCQTQRFRGSQSVSRRPGSADFRQTRSDATASLRR